MIILSDGEGGEVSFLVSSTAAAWLSRCRAHGGG